MRFWLLLVAVTFSLALPALDECHQQLAGVVQQNTFRRERDLASYLQRFPSLRRRLESLNDRSHVLDGGSGETVAMGQYTGIDTPAEQAPEFNSPANVTAVTYTLTEYRREKFQNQPKLNLLSGRFLSDISVRELTDRFGKADVILDFWGVLAYTDHLSEDLQKYIDVAKPGAQIYMVVGPREYDYVSGFGRRKSKSSVFRSTVRTRQGEVITVPDWLRTIPGLHVMESDANLVITIADPSRVRIPRLVLEGADTTVTKPPARFFREA